MNNYYLIKFAKEMTTLPGFDQPVTKDFSDRYSKNLMTDWGSSDNSAREAFYRKIQDKVKRENERLNNNKQDPYFSKNNFPRNNLPNTPIDRNGIGFGSPGYKGVQSSMLKTLWKPDNFLLRPLLLKHQYPGVQDYRTEYIQDLVMQTMGFKKPEQLQQYLNKVDKNRQNMGLMKPDDIPTWDKVNKNGKFAPKLDIAMTQQIPNNGAYFRYNLVKNKPMLDLLGMQMYIGTTPRVDGVAYVDSNSVSHEVYGHGTEMALGNDKVVNAVNNPEVPNEMLLDERKVPMSDALTYGEYPYLAFKREAAGLGPRMIRHVRRKYNNGQPFEGEGEKLREILNNPNYRFDDDPGTDEDHKRYMDSLQILSPEERKKFIDADVKRAPAWAQNNQRPSNMITVSNKQGYI